MKLLLEFKKRVGVVGEGFGIVGMFVEGDYGYG